MIRGEQAANFVAGERDLAVGRRVAVVLGGVVMVSNAVTSMARVVQRYQEVQRADLMLVQASQFPGPRVAADQQPAVPGPPGSMPAQAQS